MQFLHLKNQAVDKYYHSESFLYHLGKVGDVLKSKIYISDTVFSSYKSQKINITCVGVSIEKSIAQYEMTQDILTMNLTMYF